MSRPETARDGWRALVIQHEEPTPPGLVSAWLEARGGTVETLRIDERDPHDLDPNDYGLLVALGSEFGAYEDHIDWIGHEMDFFRDATDDVPGASARATGVATTRSRSRKIRCLRWTAAVAASGR